MPRDQRDVDVAAFTDRLAIVQRLEHGQQTAVFLHQTRQRIKETRAPLAAQLFPTRLGLASGGHGGIHIRLPRLGDMGQNLARCRVAGLETFAAFGGNERAVDEQAKAALAQRDPVKRGPSILGGGAVFHVVEDIRNGHVLTRLHVCMRPNSARSHDVPAGVRCRPAGWRHQIAADRAAASDRPALP